MDTSQVPLVFSALLVVVAVGSLIYHRRSFHRDESNLRLALEYRQKTGRGSAFRVTMTNYGRRPVTVKELLLHLKSGEKLSCSEWLPGYLPVLLEEAHSKEIWFPIHLHDCEQSRDYAALDVIRAEAIDTLGRRYLFPSGGLLLSRFLLRKLRRQIMMQERHTTSQALGQ